MLITDKTVEGRVTDAEVPREVQQVYDAMTKNAIAAGYDECGGAHDKTYGRWCDDEGSWLVGSNYEDGSGTLVWNVGSWSYRDPCTGVDRPYTFEQALADASIMFTG